MNSGEETSFRANHLSGRVALVTGGSRGIGRSIAIRLAASGASVLVTARDDHSCDETLEQIEKVGPQGRAFCCELSDRRSLEALFESVGSAFDQVDILVCNAGFNPAFGPMSSISDNKLDRIWAANVKGNIQLCNLFTPLVERSDAGSIVIVSSISALTGSNNIGAYAMAKAALLQFVRNLAIDLGPQKIRVNALSPGLTRTDLGSVALGLPAGQRLVERTPLCRVAEPEDVAGAAVFLASNDARFITGQNIIIDGGISIADYA